MEMTKKIKDHKYIDEPEFNELRNFACRWKDSPGGLELSNIISRLDSKLHENYVKLPVDMNGIVWTGHESRMVCTFDKSSSDAQPTDNNGAFFDGLLYCGGKWSIVSKSLDGSRIKESDPKECRHINEVTRKLLDLIDRCKYAESEDEIVKIAQDYSTMFECKGQEAR